MQNWFQKKNIRISSDIKVGVPGSSAEASTFLDLPAPRRWLGSSRVSPMTSVAFVGQMSSAFVASAFNLSLNISSLEI